MEDRTRKIGCQSLPELGSPGVWSASLVFNSRPTPPRAAIASEVAWYASRRIHYTSMWVKDEGTAPGLLHQIVQEDTIPTANQIVALMVRLTQFPAKLGRVHRPVPTPPKVRCWVAPPTTARCPLRLCLFGCTAPMRWTNYFK